MNMSFDKIEKKDIETIRTFVGHFKLPKSDALTKALDNLDADESLENKEILAKAFIKYLAENPEASLSNLLGKSDGFDALDKTIQEAYNKIKGEG